MARPSPTQGTAKPPRRSTARPKSGGHSVTPQEETASPSPTAVPAARVPTISARSVCWTPFHPMPTNPKPRASTARSHQLVPGPVPAITSEQAAEPSPAMTSTMRRRPPKTRSERTPKATRPTAPVTWAMTRKREAEMSGILTISAR